MKKSSIILSLLTLTLALATLPALGQSTIVYEPDITKYKFMDKVPLTSTNQTASGNAWLQVTYNNGDVQNLINVDGNKWISAGNGDISNLPNLEHYDGDADNYTFTTKGTEHGLWESTTVKSSILSPADLNYSWRQFHVLNNIEINAGDTYTFRAKVRGSIDDPSSAAIYLGNFDDNNYSNTTDNTITFPITTKWEEIEVTFGPAINPRSVFCSIQGRGYAGILEVKDVQLLANSEICHYDNTQVNAFKPVLINGTVLVTESGTLMAKNGVIGRFNATGGVNLKEGTKYVAELNIAGSVSGEITVRLGSVSNTINLTGSDQQQTITVNFPLQTSNQSAPLIIDPVSSIGESYNGTITISSAKVGHYTNEKSTTSVTLTKLNPNNINCDNDMPHNIDIYQDDTYLGTFLQIPSGTGQFTPKCFTGLDLNSGETNTLTTYTVSVSACVNESGDGPQKIQLAFGAGIPNEIIKEIIIPTDYGTVTQSFDWELGNFLNGFCAFLCYGAKTFNVDQVDLSKTIYSEYVEDVSVNTYVAPWGDSGINYADEFIPTIKNNKLIAEPFGYSQFYIKENITIKPNVTYTVRAKIKGNSGVATLRLGQWSNMATIKNINVTDEYQIVEYKFDTTLINFAKDSNDKEVDMNNGFFAMQFEGGNGYIEIESITLSSDEGESIGDNVSSVVSDAGFSKFEDLSDGSRTYYSSPTRINRYFLALKDKDFESGKTYYVTAKVRGSRPSGVLEDGSKEGVNIIVQNSSKATSDVWGWGVNSTSVDANHDKTKHDITTDWRIITTAFKPTEDVTDGYVSFHIGGYDGDFYVDWINVSDSEDGVPSLTTNPVSSGNGTNYFEITLPNHSETETYFFMIGREADDTNMPLTFEVLDGNTGTSLGNFAVGGNYDRNNINVHWEQFMTTTEIITDEKDVELGRVQVGVKVPAGVNKLHFVCTENVGDNYVFLTDNGKIYDVPKMSMNRVAVYKQRTFTLKDTQDNPTWVYPLVSRLQIEANGIPGNYPGQFKKSYWKQVNPVRDDASYESKGETLMDAVDNMKGEWGKYQSPGKLLFDLDNTRRSNDDGVAPAWNSSTWKTSDNWRNANTPYSIDILLPDFYAKKGSDDNSSLFATLSKAGLVEDGKIKMMVMLERPAEFRPASEGGAATKDNDYFPTEIVYAGTSKTGLNDSGKSNGYVEMTGVNWETVNLMIPPSNETMDVTFALNIDPSWRRVRILCKENKGSTAVESNAREMAISEIRAYIALPKLDLDKFNYDVLYNERLDDVDKIDVCVPDNQSKMVKLSNYEWTHTKGIADEINDPNNWENNWSNLITNINNKAFGNAALDLATFDYVTGDSNSGIDEITSKTRNENGWVGERQPTYTKTHEILALPGERVDLYPYSDLHESMYYMDLFARWYDYMTDKVPDYLYFITDPKSMIRTKDGFLGGKILTDGPYHGPGSVGSIYFSKGEYENKKIEDKWIAADFSISVTDNFKRRFEGHGTIRDKKFIEPIISFRHVFHITDARPYADKFSGSYANNYDYIKNNRRYISARQNADFTIRLEHPMPVEKDTPSELYYKAQDGSYKRVCSYEIRAYKTSTFRANASSITSTNVDPGSVGLINGGNMFEPYHISDDRTSKYKTANSIVDITGTDKSVLDECEYYRAIYCKAANIKAAITKTKSNKFLVRVYGKDEDGNIIKIFGIEDKPLVVAEYEVEFLPDEEASFLPEYSESLKENGKHYTHSETYLDNTFNDQDKVKRKAVTFDKYSVDNLKAMGFEANLNSLIYNETDSMAVNVMDFIDEDKKDERYEYDPDKEGHTATVKIAEQSGNRLKLPLDWSASNYSFAYDVGGDYNMFRLADHSSATVYQTAASRRNNNPADMTQNGIQQRGTYDRTFYDNNGEKKGMFYYVNAASDPGDIVEINVDKPCAGSTLYVSGWVNEFNDHMPETANLIINYYANIVNVSDTTQIARKIQIHGFETGYVPNGSKGMDEVGVDGYYTDKEEGNQGVWMHFYYSFVPSAARISNLLTDDEFVKSYSLVLENNSISSRGADYAIDEIRAYVAPPIVEVDQLDPLCGDTDGKEDRDVPINIEVRIPYEALLEAFELSEDNDETVDDIDKPNNIKTIYFAVVNKKEYNERLEQLKEDENYANDKQKSLYEAFSAGVISYNQIHNDDVNQMWGSITFNTTYLKNNGFNKANYPIGHAMYHDVDDERYISFITNPPVKYLVKNNTDNRDFMIVIAEDKDGSMDISSDITGIELAEALDFGTQCCRQADFELRPPTDILIDGVLQGNRNEITCCENQHPVVQVILKDKDLNPINLKDNASIVIDWYAGSKGEFNEEEISGTDENSTNGMSLWEVLYNFRSDYPTASDWNQYYRGETYSADEKDEDGNVIHNAGELKNPDAKSYTKAMRSYLRGLVTDKKLYLNQASYIFPEVTFGEGETSTEIYVTAVPVDNNVTLVDKIDVDGNIVKDEQGNNVKEENLICLDPTQVKITVTRTSPAMKNGFDSDDIVYPSDMVDVPLRAGLKQLDIATTEGTVPTKGEAFTLVATERSDKLIIPLRDLARATNGVTNFKPLASDPYCYLAVTNDPDQSYSTAYKEGRANAPADVTRAGETNANGIYDSEYSLPLVGEISMDAQIDGTDFNSVKVTFYKDAMKFKEGYYYTFKFPYEENYDGVTLPEGLDESSMPCHGETYFTIKVVPEYQVWTGGASLNWNNDDNWRRVSGDSDKDVLPSSGGNLSSKTNWKDRYTAGGENTNTFSYAPLDFTKVIIPSGASYPQLAARTHDRARTDGSLSLKNGHGNAVSYVWAEATDSDPDSNAPKSATAAGSGNESASENIDGNNYHPTKYIQYDMAAVTYTKDDGSKDVNVYCRPWYANACEQIHFDSNAEILNQQYLDYQKAWVDMEMIPDRWYNVASPLQDVVAGDMYLPKADGRQATELFTDINFNTAVNDRFHPAVYQRGWDKGTETVYNIKDETNGSTLPGCPKEEKVALASTWSHVYNDVTETYAPGMGFSVKTDVTRISDFPADGLVKFRLPKNDDNYSYFVDGSTAGNSEHTGNLSRVNNGRLFDGTETTVTLTKATEGSLFLVGNPFMAHLDMVKFLEKNANENTGIESKFWILTSDRQVGVVMDHEKEGVMLANDELFTLTSGNMTATPSTLDKLPPMQGFFVKANKPGKTLTVTFTPDMMAVQAYTETDNKPILKAPAYGTRGDGDDIIRVSTPESTAIIRLSGSAEKGYAASEDVEMIDDSNQRGIRRIYTVAGTMASAINQTPDADGVEVGLMAPADSLTVVTFNGLALEDYLLYDTATGEMTQLYDGFELEMEGSVSGRYFLTAGIDTAEIEDSTIRIMPVGHEVVVTAPAVCGEMTVRVFDTLGREVAKAEGFEQEVRIGLEPGVYAVEAIGSDAGRKSAKLQIR